MATTGAALGSVENKSGLGLGVGVQGFIGAEYFIFPKMSIGAQYTYRVGVDIQGNSECYGIESGLICVDAVLSGLI